MAGAVGFEPTSNRFKGDDNRPLYDTPTKIFLRAGLDTGSGFMFDPAFPLDTPRWCWRPLGISLFALLESVNAIPIIRVPDETNLLRVLPRRRKMVLATGLEPVTSWMSTTRSNQLS